MRLLFLALVMLTGALSVTAADWNPLNTGITDDFNDVYFYNDNEGVVIGNKGIYYTLTGGGTPASWVRYSIPGNMADNDLYNHCRFIKMTAIQDSKEVYITAYDMVNQKAVIFYMNLSTLTYKICYTGVTNSVLYGIRYSSYFKAVYAVGEAGLFVRYQITTGVSTVLRSLTTNTLRSLSFDDYSYNLNLGGDNVYFKLYLVYDTFSVISSVTPPFSITSMESDGSQLYVTSPSGFYKASTNLPVQFTELTAYKNGPLHPVQVVKPVAGTRYFVTTDHGVYKKFNDALEIQPASKGYVLNAMSAFSSEGLAVGCGNNGLLIKSANGGGGTIPYLDISVKTGCKTDQIDITKPLTGSSTTCNVKIFDAQNQLVSNSNSCAFTYSLGWNAAGDFTLQYVLINAAGLSDTLQVPMHIPEAPAVNMPISISDNILCRKEQVMVTVGAAQTGWNYMLRRQGDDVTGYGSAAGNGGTVQFQSAFVDKTGTYYIQVQSQQGGCQRSSTNVVPITVEQPKGRLASEFFNSFAGENIQFSAISTDAQNFKWTFDNTASQAVATGKNVQVSFNSMGEKWVQLESWSNNGCYDTSYLKATRIGSEAGAPDECFNLNVPGEDVQYNAVGGVPLLRDMELTTDGILIGGGSYKYVLRSVTGDTMARTDYGGSYLAKYTKKGTLRWRVYSKYPNYTCPTCYYSTKPAVQSIETSGDGSILFAGNDDANTWLYFNNGDSVQVAPGTSPGGIYGYVIKLNSHGARQWKGAFVNARVRVMKQDKAGNIWVVLQRGYPTSYIRDGRPAQPLSGSSYGVDYPGLLVKLNSDGDVLYTAVMDITGDVIGDEAFNDLVIDNDGNVWIAGTFSETVSFYSNNGARGAYVSRLYADALKSSFIVKYSSSCNYLFHINAGIIPTTGFSYLNMGANKIALDSLNNVYVLGRAEARSDKDVINFVHANGAVNTATVGGFFLSKFNSAGDYQWTNGSRYASSYTEGNSLFTTGKSVVITSNIRDNNGAWNGMLTSTDNNPVGMSMNEAGFLVAEYDYNGKLLRAVNSQTAPGGYLLPNTMYRNNGRLYIAGETSMNNGGGGSFPLFNQALSSQGYDGFFTVLNDNYCYAGQQPVANAGADAVICAGSNTTIGVPASGDTYLWTSSPAGFTSNKANPTVSPAITTYYYLTVSSIAGFVARDTVLITTTGAKADAGPDRVLCMGDKTTLGIAATGNAYAWSSNPAGFSAAVADPEVGPTVTTSYFLEVTNGACSSKDTVTISVATRPVADAGIDRDICAGSSAAIGAPTVNGNTYSWTSSPGGFTATSASLTVTPAVTTSYFLKVNNSTCSAYDTVVITVHSVPIANAGRDAVNCNGSNLTLGTAGTAGNTYSWSSLPAGFSSNDARPLVSPLTFTTYFMEVSNGYCTSKDTINVSPVSVPPAHAGADATICMGNSTGIGAMPDTGYRFTWTSLPAGFTENHAGAVVSPAVTTSYFLVVSNGYCSSRDTVVVQVNPLPVANAGPDKNICVGTGTTIGVPAQTGYSYNWTSVPPGFMASSADPYVAPTVTTTYQLLQTQVGTGCTATDLVNITVDTCNERVADYILYPNPASGYIIIKFNSIPTEPTLFELIDRNGNSLLQQKLDKETKIDVSKFPAGIYSYRILKGGNMINQSSKFIIQH